jgi:hypothetical protein
MHRVLVLLLLALTLSGCIFHGYVEPITIYDKPTETPSPLATPTAELTAEPTTVTTLVPTPEATATTMPEPTATVVPSGVTTLTVSTTTDDFHQWQKGIVLEVWPAWVGSWDGVSEHAGWRFQNIPDVPVERAVLRLYGTHGDGFSLKVRIHALAYDNAAPFIAGSDVMTLALTTAFTPLTESRKDVWNEYDVTAAVQEVQSRAGWLHGNALALVAVSEPTPNNADGGIEDYSSGGPLQAAQLVLYPAMPVSSAAAPETVSLLWLERAAEEAGIVLMPGMYTCELTEAGPSACVIYSDGVPGGKVCVTPLSWGACE